MKKPMLYEKAYALKGRGFSRAIKQITSVQL
jgi:hypothetical protein